MPNGVTLQLESIFVQTPGLRIHALAAGRDNTGPAVVLVHGFPQTSHAFRHQLVGLAAAGLRAFAIDTRGYGLTDKPGTRVSRAMLADDVMRFCQAVDLQSVTLVGHDWGGLIAFKAAIDNPQLFTRLALLDSNCTVITPDITHPYWFKVEPLPEAFLAEHARDLVEVRIGGKDSVSLGGRPGNPYGVPAGPRPTPTFVDAVDVEHYAASLEDPDAQRTAIQYYRYGMPIHRIIQDPGSPNGERYQPLSEREVTAMWMHPDGFDAHPWRHEYHDCGPEDRHKRYPNPALFIYGRQFAGRFPHHGDLVTPGGDPFADQYSRYFPDLRVREADCGHYVPEEVPDLVTDEIIRLINKEEQ